MADPHWTGYVGMAAGILGTITGIAGAILGVVSYRRTSQIKQMDSRLELKKAINQAQANISVLLELLPRANRSHTHVASARGLSRSGAMEKWKEDYDGDWERFVALKETVETFGSDFTNADLPTLESKLADIHHLNLRIQQLVDKYKATLVTDETDRERLQAQQDRWRTS
jgi:hypothetical protein